MSADPAAPTPRGSAAPTPGRSAVPVACLLALGSLCYLSWVAAPRVAAGGLDPVSTYASELAATDQPGSAFFRMGDVLAGLLVATAAVLWLRTLRSGEPRPDTHGRLLSRPVRFGVLALAIFGVVTVADAASPLSCAPSADAACAARESAFAVPWTHTAHVGTSVVASIAMLTAVLLLTWQVLRGSYAGRAGGAVPVLLGLAAIGYVGGTAWTLLEVARASVAWPWPPLLGIAQRVQVGSASLWLLLLALVVLRTWRGRESASSVGAAAGSRP